MSNNLDSLPFRLLRVFEALQVHGSVSKAAAALDLPQPAVSQGLSRLRTLFGDPLFVRSRGGMIPTQRAIDLREPIASILGIAQEKILAPSVFDPAQSKREFRIISTDFGALTILPTLLPRIRSCAPKVTLRVMPLDDAVFERLASRQADFALGILTSAPHDIRTRIVFQDVYACALRHDHPALLPGATKRMLSEAEHVVVPSRLDASGQIDDAAFRSLRGKRVVVSVPGYSVLPTLLSETDLIALVPRTASRPYFEGKPIRIVDPPFSTPKITVVEAWHVHDDADVGIRWMLDEVARVFDSFEP
jgi:DNA-binding transcriptional LysR family regulator